WFAAAYHDQYEAAWYGICERLLEADEQPEHHELIRAGQDAVNRLVNGELHHAGFFKYKTCGTAYGPGSMPGFVKFWNNPVRLLPPDDVIEVRALAAIWANLKEREQQALAALAVYEDYAAAAQAMGVTPGTFRGLIKRGRQAFLTLWHEGETPSRIWRADKRTGRRPVSDPAELERRAQYAARARQRRAERRNQAAA